MFGVRITGSPPSVKSMSEMESINCGALISPFVQVVVACNKSIVSIRVVLGSLRIQSINIIEYPNGSVEEDMLSVSLSILSVTLIYRPNALSTVIAHYYAVYPHDGVCKIAGS